MTSTALITLSVPRARVHRECTPMQPDLPLIPLDPPRHRPSSRESDRWTGTGGEGRPEIGALRIYRCYLAAVYRTCGFSPLARFIPRQPLPPNPPFPACAQLLLARHDRVLFIRFLSFVRSQIRCFLASRFVPPFTISRLFLLSLFYSTFAFAGGQLMPFEKYSAPFAIHQQGRVLFSNPRRVFGIPFPIAALLTDLFS